MAYSGKVAGILMERLCDLGKADVGSAYSCTNGGASRNLSSTLDYSKGKGVVMSVIGEISFV